MASILQPFEIQASQKRQKATEPFALLKAKESQYCGDGTSVRGFDNKNIPTVQ
jgi:hypothetical protein